MPPSYQHRNHILVVGWDQASYHDLAGILRKEGYGVLYAWNVNDAMDLLHHNEIEIVLTEKDMPDRDGIALLREIKRVKPGVQVMIMTDNGCVHSYLEAMVLGAFEYFNKPVKKGVLCRAVLKALSLGGHQGNIPWVPKEEIGGALTIPDQHDLAS